MVSNRESAVKFVNIEEMYSFKEDLICKFIPNHYTPQDGDRIAMFKLGWKSVKDYVIFEWAPVGIPETLEHEVVFEKHDLPRDTSELYQICYISSENILHGATIPFQFQSEIPKRNSRNILTSSQTEEPIVLSSFENFMKLRLAKKENVQSLQRDGVLCRMSKVSLIEIHQMNM
ncbi:hypothetical protein WA026_000032 [Henosepilachna vigintioctopunctata]|uniref:SKICH domain-containing protein n=1 Tax=Henosepilachna vigintioctopunctata TaxID=420089 RepID=A0AAW1UZ41_9CUCU